MAKMTLDDLKKLRDAKRSDLERRSPENKAIHVVVGMGTSGIAAGAKDTLAAFVDELGKHNLTNVAVRQVGSMGLDHAEPTVEVRKPGLPTVIYGKVTPAVAKAIVERHIVRDELVSEHIFDRPAVDIIDQEA